MDKQILENQTLIMRVLKVILEMYATTSVKQTTEVMVLMPKLIAELDERIKEM